MHANAIMMIIVSVVTIIIIVFKAAWHIQHLHYKN